MKSLNRLVTKKRYIYLSVGVALLIGGAIVYGLVRQKASPITPSASSSSTQTAKTTVGAPSTDTTPKSSSAAPGRSVGTYPLHENITATVFWVGEGADSSNDYIHNRASAWVSDWTSAYGGIDAPEKRCGYRPCSFMPKENPFYFALPFNDYGDNGLKSASALRKIPWYTGKIPENTSILKNHWIQVTHDKKVAYAQWEDVGPFGEDDAAYVFGSARPTESRAGLDLSPALADYLGVDGRAAVSWRFVESADVPQGEWTRITTQSQLSD